jgi:hypothetical protein
LRSVDLRPVENEIPFKNSDVVIFFYQETANLESGYNHFLLRFSFLFGTNQHASSWSSNSILAS